MCILKYSLLLLSSFGSLQAYSTEATNFEEITKGWQADKAFMVQHQEIFEKHCTIWGITFYDLLDVTIAYDKTNFYPMKFIEEYREDDPRMLRPYTALERSALLAYQSGYEECAMIAIEELNDGYEEAMAKDKFNQSLFSGAFGGVWGAIVKGTPHSILIGACLGVVYEYSKDYAVRWIWNPEHKLKETRLLYIRAEKAEEHLLTNLRPVFD